MLIHYLFKNLCNLIYKIYLIPNAKISKIFPEKYIENSWQVQIYQIFIALSKEKPNDY